MIQLITGERTAVTNIINRCIDNMMVQVGNMCGLRVHMNENTTRFCVNRSEVVQTLKDVSSKEHKAAIYLFIFNYFGRVVYEQTVGTAHQAACEAAAVHSLQVSFQGSEDMKRRNQTCIGKLYSRLLNKRQQRVHDSVFSFDCRVGVEKGVSPGKKKGRRPKTVFYIHKLVFDHGGGRKKISAGVEEVRMFRSWCHCCLRVVICRIFCLTCTSG
jgi:hypothetical protein